MKENLLSNILFIILIIIFSTFFLYPVIDGIIISFTDWKGIIYHYNFVGLDNYIMIFNDERTSSSIITTIKYLFLLLPLSLGLGYIGASVIYRLRIFKSSVLFISFFPYIITPVVTCMLWNQLYYKFFTSIGEVLNIELWKRML